MKNGDALKDMGGGWLLLAAAKTDECELVRMAPAAGGYNLVATTVRYQASGPNQAEAMAKAIMNAAATFGQPGATPTQVPVGSVPTQQGPQMFQPAGQQPQSTSQVAPPLGPIHLNQPQPTAVPTPPTGAPGAVAQGLMSVLGTPPQGSPNLFGQTRVVGQTQQQLGAMAQAAIVVEYEIMPGITTDTVNIMAQVAVETLQRHGLTDVAASSFRSRKGQGTTIQLRGSLPYNLNMESFTDIAEAEFGHDCKVCKAGEENRLDDEEDTF